LGYIARDLAKPNLSFTIIRGIMRLIIASIMLLMSTQASATLIDRGSGLIYDDVLNITWLQDVQYALTEVLFKSGHTWIVRTTISNLRRRGVLPRRT